MVPFTVGFSYFKSASNLSKTFFISYRIKIAYSATGQFSNHLIPQKILGKRTETVKKINKEPVKFNLNKSVSNTVMFL